MRNSWHPSTGACPISPRRRCRDFTTFRALPWTIRREYNMLGKPCFRIELPRLSSKRRLQPADPFPFLIRPPDEYHIRALQIYNRAMRGFQLRVEDGKATLLLALLSCLLFICIELIRDDIFLALSLLVSMSVSSCTSSEAHAPSAL